MNRCHNCTWYYRRQMPHRTPDGVCLIKPEEISPDVHGNQRACESWADGTIDGPALLYRLRSLTDRADPGRTRRGTAVRSMSFQLTTGQIRNRTKTVTRRDVHTWPTLKPGDRLKAVDRCMGFKKGEHPEVLAIIEVVSVRVERLRSITQSELEREGFPGKTIEWFIRMFLARYGYDLEDSRSDIEIRRIEFRYVEER